MTPTDTIREALRRRPVMGGSSFVANLPLVIECDTPIVYRWGNRPSDPDHEPCSRRWAESAMIAAWVEALIKAGCMFEPFERSRMFTIMLPDERWIQKDSLLEALAAAVCAVMPEPRRCTDHSAEVQAP